MEQGKNVVITTKKRKCIQKYWGAKILSEKILRRRQNMCYLIAKQIDQVGCVAWKTTYGEYEPDHFVGSEAEFEKGVVNM